MEDKKRESHVNLHHDLVDAIENFKFKDGENPILVSSTVLCGLTALVLHASLKFIKSESTKDYVDGCIDVIKRTALKDLPEGTLQ